MIANRYFQLIILCLAAIGCCIYFAVASARVHGIEFRIPDTSENRLNLTNLTERIATQFKFNPDKLDDSVYFVLRNGRIWIGAYFEKPRWEVQKDDIKNFDSLTSQNQLSTNRLTAKLKSALSTNTIVVITASPLNDSSKRELVYDLNGIIITNPLFFDLSNFSNIKLSARTKEKIGALPLNGELFRLHRLLLDDAFPSMLRPMETDSIVVFLEENGMDSRKYKQIQSEFMTKVQQTFGNTTKFHFFTRWK